MHYWTTACTLKLSLVGQSITRYCGAADCRPPWGTERAVDMFCVDGHLRSHIETCFMDYMTTQEQIRILSYE
ncbi:hypothetical protein NDU88_006240 [Pleurodeles waltl]|uniref:Secreted protein n=1 Tax=Pleurodeles waltl TaxID=8319 RepID=A0AAV7SP05_PLEWA|nr:hypothetical protein NDU88_006240 [Pleurodeles waltl]